MAGRLAAKHRKPGFHARTVYRTADDETKAGRYTDVWARRDGAWRAGAAHVTRG